MKHTIHATNDRRHPRFDDRAGPRPAPIPRRDPVPRVALLIQAKHLAYLWLTAPVLDREPHPGALGKLVPIQTEKGKLSQSEMDISKTKIQSLMNSMYPNSSITFEVASSHYDITNTDEYENLEKYESWSSALNGFKSLRDLELNNTNCNRFYYGLVKDDDEMKFAVGGLAKRTTSVEKNSCPSLVGMGLNSKDVAELAAHEIGHNLGMLHDFGRSTRDKRTAKNGDACTGVGGYMDYRPRPKKWSQCSVDDFTSYYNRETSNGKNWCLPLCKLP